MGKRIKGISRNGKHSYNLTGRQDIGEERVSNLKNRHESEISEDERQRQSHFSKERQKKNMENILKNEKFQHGSNGDSRRREERADTPQEL